MKIRTQLILAFLLLAILPLAGIVLYSYASSSAAVRESALEEAEALSAEMEASLERVREALRRRVGALPFRVLTQVEPGADEQEVIADLRNQLGEMASLVDALAFEPSPAPAAPTPPGSEPPPAPPIFPATAPPVPNAFYFETENETRVGEQPKIHLRVDADEIEGAPSITAHGIATTQSGTASENETDADERAWVIELVTEDRGATSADRSRTRSESRQSADGNARTWTWSTQQGQQGSTSGAATSPSGPPTAGTVDPDLARLYYDAYREQMDPTYSPGGRLDRTSPPTVDLDALRKWAESGSQGLPPESGSRDGEGSEGTGDEPTDPEAREFIHARRWASMAEARRRDWQRRAEMVMGEDFDVVPIREGGRLVGMVRPRINPETVLEMVFGQMPRDAGEIPFAVDNEGHLYTPDGQDRQRLLEALGRNETEGPVFASNHLPSRNVMDHWVVATSRHPTSGLAFGVARPFGDSLSRLKSTSVRNFAFGLLMIVLAVVGILPVSGHLAKRLGLVTTAAQRIARGDLDARVPEEGGGELAQLARAFNSMAHDLRDQQERLVAEERRQRDRELERQLMHAELERRGQELEEARQFQLSMLPRRLPDHPDYLLTVSMRTATEVGGDYYDFCMTDDAPLTIALGDATGHGARAGTMVTVIKSLFTDCTFTATSPTAFLADAQRTIERMALGRMAMALQVLQLEGDCLRLTNAGMPPVLWHRVGGNRTEGEPRIEELLVEGMPLGSLQKEFRERSVRLHPGDTLLLFSDGLAEQPDPAEGPDAGPVGYDFVHRSFEKALAAAGDDPERLDLVLASLEGSIDELTRGEAPADDISLLLIRVRG